MTVRKPTRGIRNNNPGNIRHGDKWQGMAVEQPDKSFITFVSPEYGIRALAKILITYEIKGVNTVLRIISRWAPPNENDTPRYIDFVAGRLGVDMNDVIDVDSYAVMLPLVTAIIEFENGQQPYTLNTLKEGLRLAGVADAPARTNMGKKVALATTAVTATANAAVDPDNLKAAQGVLQPIAEISPILNGLFVVITLAIVAIVWFDFDRKAKRTGG